MSDELLGYYNRELSYLRKLGARFAEAYPKIAGRLRLHRDSAEDPHVERVIQAFAFLSARLRLKLDDEFPELAETLLGVLYPHYLAPIPSMGIVQFHLDPSQGEVTSGYEIPRGTQVESDPIEGQPCRFRTGYPVTLWPLTVVSARLRNSMVGAPRTALAADAAAHILIRLKCSSPVVKLSALKLSSLRFHLAGTGQAIYPLYELIFNHTLGVSLSGDESDARPPVVLDRRSLRPVGMDRDEGLLPYAARSFPGYRLLTEYFAFPEKFLGMEVSGLDRPGFLTDVGETFDICLFLDRAAPELERTITAETFRLGTTPVVNLYSKRAEPVPITHATPEYRIFPDARRPQAHEVHSIDRVTAVSPLGEHVEYQPFYSLKQRDPGSGAAYWLASRRRDEARAFKGDEGTELYLSLVDLNFKPTSPANWTLQIETTCCNRDLPARLPVASGEARLSLPKGGPISRIECLTPFTATRRPALGRGAVWRLLSHLSLNHLSLSGGEEGVESLRAILALYNFADRDETIGQIEGITGVSTRPMVAPIGGRQAGPFVRGVEVQVEFDEDRYAGSGLFLLASVLERFLGLYVTINSFTRMVASTRKRGEIRRWPPRAGDRVLL